MFDFVLLLPLTLVSAFFVFRLILISAGWLKNPVMRQLESYSNSYSTYYPLPAMMIWSSMFAVSGSLLLMLIAQSRFPIYLPGILLMLGAWISVQYADGIMARSRWMQPKWYRDLQDRAGRYEQRRIAFAWIRLTPRIRTKLSLNDHAFELWVDLVLLSTSDTTADTFVYEKHYRLLKRRIAVS